ncbi:MAG: hypothetical protein KA436_02160 [Oligoflexales bacterium]|nr:hypothetical protein [Oligoflexales bacterium]
MEEFYEIFEEEEKTTLKQHYRSVAGQEVGKDFFIYACLEAEHTLKNVGEGCTSVNLPEWSGLSSSPTPPLQELFQWYADRIPELGQTDPIDYELCQTIVLPFVKLTHDLAKYMQLRGVMSLPPRLAEGTVDEKSTPFWTEIDSYLSKLFPARFVPMCAYLTWRYAPRRTSSWDLASLPPVGRFFRVLRDGSRRKEPSNREPDPASVPPRDELPRGESSREEGEALSDKLADSGSSRPHHRAPSSPRDSHEDRSRPARDSHEDRSRSRRPQRSRDDQGDERAREIERLALLEVEKAALAIKKQPSMAEYRLKPQNSYIRRLQHSRVGELGLHSASVGENEQRAVLITRNESETD